MTPLRRPGLVPLPGVRIRRLYREPANMRRLILPLLLVCALALPSTGAALAPAEDWTPVADGIDYREFSLAGPNRVFVARMDRGNPNVTLDAGLAQGNLAEGTEIVSAIADRYQQAINSWGDEWGQRNRVVVAINGSFFDRKSGVPWSGLIQSGWYAKRYGSLAGSSGFVWTMERGAFIGECVDHRADRQVVKFMIHGEILQIDGINESREKNSLILYTPQFDQTTRTDSRGIEVVVEMTRPAAILPLPAMAYGYVREIRDRREAAEIPFDHVVLSAVGKPASELRAAAQLGELIGISMEITDLGDDCKTPDPHDWTKAYAGLGGSFLFLKDGELIDIDEAGAVVRNPRTAVCFNDDYIHFVVVDGREDGYSVGMDMEELGEFCRKQLDAEWGLNQDGGGSSTMWVDGTVRNRPSDGWERPVANALMMIEVAPAERSVAYQSGQRVAVTSPSDLYLGPGTNFWVRSTLLPSTQGVIIPSLNGLDGILAKGTYWWKVGFGKTVGWVPEWALSPSSGAASGSPEIFLEP
jgi:hypothetical protein